MTFAQTECKTVVHISISPCCPALRLTLSLRWILFPWHVLLLAFLEFSDVLVSLQKWKRTGSTLDVLHRHLRTYDELSALIWPDSVKLKPFLKYAGRLKGRLFELDIIFIACDTFLTCYDESDWTDHYRRVVSETAEPTKAQVECWTHSQWQ